MSVFLTSHLHSLSLQVLQVEEILGFLYFVSRNKREEKRNLNKLNPKFPKIFKVHQNFEATLFFNNKFILLDITK